MAVFVTLAIALAVLSAALLIVGASALLKALGGLRSAAERSGAQLQPLADELQSEAAVTAAEVSELQRRLAADPASR